MKATWIFIFLTALILLAHPFHAQAQGSGAAATLFAAANRDRKVQGLPPLTWSAPLETAARQHALRLATKNTLSHQLPGEPPPSTRAAQAGARFTSMAENVAEGPSAESIHQQWMNSPPHRANLLDPQRDSVGIAVASRKGTLFAVEDFSLAVRAISIEEQEKIVDSRLREHGLKPLDYTADARRSCKLDNGYSGSHEPDFVLHYATTELETLPSMLEQRIQTGNYHAEVVGACQSSKKYGFSSYRIAVLLYK